MKFTYLCLCILGANVSLGALVRADRPRQTYAVQISSIPQRLYFVSIHKGQFKNTRKRRAYIKRLMNVEEDPSGMLEP